MSTTPAPFVFAREEGPSFWFMGKALMTIKATGEQTNGAFGLVEELLPPGYSTFYHRNGGSDQTLYVLEGEITVIRDQQKLTAKPGTLVYLPRNTPNGFRVEGTTPVRLLLLITPAGFEQFFVEGGEPAEGQSSPPGGPPNWQKVQSVGAKYQNEPLGPLPA
jgi:quercetin dioxygenase-like cupin family protein